MKYCTDNLFVTLPRNLIKYLQCAMHEHWLLVAHVRVVGGTNKDVS